MADLSNPYMAPGASFGGLMNTLSIGGLTAALQVIQDGFGHNSALSLSTDAININTQMGGGFLIDNVQLNASAQDINDVCLFGDFGGLTSALELPLGTTAERPAPTNGQIRYNSETESFEGYKNGAWVNFSTVP